MGDFLIHEVTLDEDKRLHQLQMSDCKSDFEKISNMPDFSILESKIREKIYELSSKRRFFEESRMSLAKLELERHEEIQRADKAVRELAETKIHLDVAIKAAREAEGERSTGRELLARQGAQLEATARERDLLQETNRSLQLEQGDLLRELEDTKSKMTSQVHLLKLIQKKDAQKNLTFDMLVGEVSKWKERESEVKELCGRTRRLSRGVLAFLTQHKAQIHHLREQKSQLQNKITSLSVLLERDGSGTTSYSEIVPNLHYLNEWKTTAREMVERVTDLETEVSSLQSSLDSALAAVATYQDIEAQLKAKQRDLEVDIDRYKGHKEDSSSQTEDVYFVAEGLTASHFLTQPSSI